MKTHALQFTKHRGSRQLNKKARPVYFSILGVMGLANCGGSESDNNSSGDGDTSSFFSVSGDVVKGPVSNALVFVDYNNDGLLSAGEPSLRTDASGNFEFTNLEKKGPVIAITDETSVDTSTDLVISGMFLTAPEGSTVISPLTTLMQQANLTSSEVVSALNLPDGIDLTSYNPFADGVDAETALAVEIAAQQVSAVIRGIASAMTEAGVSSSDAAELASNAVAEALTEKNIGDLSDSSFIGSAITLATSELNSSQAQAVSLVASAVATATANLNVEIAGSKSISASGEFALIDDLLDQIRAVIENDGDTSFINFTDPQAVKEAVSGSDGSGEEENSQPTGAVTISGIAAEGQILTAITDTLDDPDGLGTLSYQWKADGVAIAGATAQTFTLTADQVGKNITVEVSYTDGGRTNENVISLATDNVVVSKNDPTSNASSLTHYKISTDFLVTMKESGVLPEQALSTTEVGIAVDTTGIMTAVFQKSSTVSEEKNQPAVNALTVVRFDPSSGVLTDVSDTVLNERELNGTIRKIAVGDLNDDGFDDFAFALNNEDGRSFDGWKAQPQVLLSGAGNEKYELTNFGIPQMTHNIQVLTLSGAENLIAIDNIQNLENGGGYFDFSSGHPEIIDLSRPMFEGSSLKDEVYFAEDSSLLSVGSFDIFSDSSSLGSDLVGLALYRENEGVFNLVDTDPDQIDTGVYAKFNSGIQFVPTVTFNQEIARVTGYNEIKALQIGDSTFGVAKGALITMTATGEPSTSPSGEFIELFEDNKALQYFKFFQVNESSLTNIEASSNENLIVSNENVNFFDLEDINSDKIPDLIVYEMGKLPVIFLSDNGFDYTKVELGELINLDGEEEKFDQASYLTRLYDIDANGDLDLIYLQRDGESQFMSEEFGIIMDIPILNYENDIV